MSMKQSEVIRLVDTELDSIGDASRRAALASCLVVPELHFRTWAYGPGSFECWTVARDASSSTWLVYCQGGFRDLWGALPPNSGDLGMDANWFSTLDDAFIASLWDGPLPPGYEVL